MTKLRVVMVVVLAIAACDDHPGAVDAMVPLDASPDAPPTVVACSEAIAVERSGTTIDTCTGQDRVDGCGPPNTKELTIVFSPPPNPRGPYVIKVFPAGEPQAGPGIQITSFDATCSNILLDRCGGGITGGVLLNTTTYAIVEDPTGGCGRYDVVVLGPIEATR
jgi:hypothetical protein